MLTYLHAPLQLFDNYGSRLVSGAVFTYEIGSTVNKISYKDIYGSAPNTFPVILDHAGRAEIYMNGSYTIRITDKDGVDIDTFDIRGSSQDSISTTAVGSWAQNEVVVVNNYADVRAINSPYAIVFCQGRVNQNDGGEGWFVLDISSLETDDDSVILKPNTTGIYRRYNVQVIDPRWSGVVYDTIVSQAVYLSAASTASIRHAKPLAIEGSIYLNSNFITSADIEFSDNGSLVSTLPITVSFYGNVIGSPDCFKNTVQPKFYKIDEVKYSWFYSDNVEGRVAKLLACTDEECLINFDEDISTTASIIIPSNFTFKCNNTITFANTSPLDLTIPKIEKVNANVFKFQSFSTVGTLTIPFEINCEFFSGIGFGADDTIPVQAALRSGNVVLTKSMVSSGAHITYEPISLRSDNIKKSEMPTLTVSSLAFSTLLLKNIALFASLNGTSLNANNVRMVCDGTCNNVSLNDVEYISGKLTTQDAILENVTYTGSSVPCSKISKLTNSQFSNCLMSGSDKIEGLVSNVTITPTSANSLIVKDSIINNLYYNDSSDTFKPTLILSGSNIINNSNFVTKNYKMLCHGNSSSATFNSCTFSDNVTVSEASNKYTLNGCEGGSLEVNGKRNSIDYVTKVFTSGTLTDSLTNWKTKTGDDAIDVSLDGIGIKFNQSYVFDWNTGIPASTIKPGALGTTYTYLYIPTLSSDFDNFIRFGGRLKVTTKNAGNSFFKICISDPQYRMNKAGQVAYLTTSAGSLWNGSPKLLMETGIITNDSSNEISTEFSYQINQNSFRPLIPDQGTAFGYPVILTDHLGIRQDVLNSSATTPLYTNADVVFVGFVDVNTEVKIEWVCEIPVNDIVSTTYFKTTSARSDTYMNVTEDYLGTPFVSSGTNNISNKWIFNTSYSQFGDKVLMRGTNPTIMTSANSLSGGNTALFHNGINFNLDAWRFLYNKYNNRLELNIPQLLKNDVEITLDNIVDKNNLSSYPSTLSKPLSATRFYKTLDNLS